MVWLTCRGMTFGDGQVLQWAIIVRNAYADPLNILQVTATFKCRLQWQQSYEKKLSVHTSTQDESSRLSLCSLTGV